jgi:Ca2+-binding RTX toxin-like protein
MLKPTVIFGTNNGDTIDELEFETFIGGTGNDVVNIRVSYLFGNGAIVVYRGGNDVINDAYSGEAIRLWEGINQEDVTLSSFLNIDTVRADLTLNIAGYGTLTINSIDISIDPWLSSITLDSGGRFFVTQEGITFSGINETATTLKGSCGVDKWTGRGNTNETYYGRGGDDDLDGGPGNDVLNGGAGNDVLSGSEGSDTLLGTYGDDELHGGPGNDILNGGAGDDTADYNTAAAGIVVDLSTGEALADGNGGTDTLIGIEYVTGSPFDETIRGDSRANHLTATGGIIHFLAAPGMIFTRT